MSPDFKLSIVTPNRTVFSGDVEYLRAPGSHGYFGVLRGHAPFLTELRVGEIKVRSGQRTQYLATSGGLAQVSASEVVILAESAEDHAEIDVERAQAAMKRAQDRMQDRHLFDFDRARAALMRSINRIQVAERS